MEKISIIGSGNVGANTAFFIAEKGVTDVCLYDIQEGVSKGKSLDMMEAAPIRKYRNRITGIDNLSGIEGSETVVIAAGNSCSIDMKAESLFAGNWETVKGIVEQIMKHSPDCIIVVATEPVDLLTCMIAQRFALPRNRLFGLGGILDSTWFKSAISRELSISPENVIAMVIGRHAEDMIVLPEYTSVSGIPLSQLITAETIERLGNEVRKAGSLMADLAECPGTYYTPSAAAAEVVDSIHMDLRRIVSLSIMLEGEYGISGAALSLPCVVGKNGVERVLTPALSGSQREALKKSAGAVMDIIAGAKP